MNSDEGKRDLAQYEDTKRSHCGRHSIGKDRSEETSLHEDIHGIRDREEELHCAVVFVHFLQCFLQRAPLPLQKCENSTGRGIQHSTDSETKIRNRAS